MAKVAKLTYVPGRGRSEHIRLLLAANNIDWEEVSLKERSEFVHLIENGELFFDQVPLLEIDGMKMVQGAAISRYLARKYMKSGDSKEQYRIDMLWEGTRDFIGFFLGYGFMGKDEEMSKKCIEIAIPRYMPKFEKVLKENNTGFLVGNYLTLADIGLLEVILNIEERMPEEFERFPAVQNFLKNMKSIPSLADYLANRRFPMVDAEYVALVRRVFNF